MLARLRDGERQLALEQSRADQAPTALCCNGMDGVDVSVTGSEGDDAVGAPPSRLHETVAVRRVVGNDRNPIRLKPLEDFSLGLGDRLDRAEILDMRRGDRRD